jgi:hypothetical protein
MIEDARHTSTNYRLGISEFDETNLEESIKMRLKFICKECFGAVSAKYVKRYYIKKMIRFM